MATVVDDVRALSAFTKGQQYFLRSKCDPRFLIASHSGDVFTRRDGQPWEWDGYKCVPNFADGTVTLEPATAKDDQRTNRRKYAV